ncbi:MAG: AMP-binding protein, partial [Candidatus Omnitrophica bacterium]|nr:AMP-binding protein [Candidatus Omnitrophota bacterium]
PEEVVYILNDAEVKAVIYWSAAGVNMATLKDRIPSLNCLLVAGASGEKGLFSVEEVIGRPCPPVKIPSLNQVKDVAAILYTSGTTGQPKGAMLTHRNLLFNVNSIVNTLPLRQEDIFVAVLPLFHAFGATACMLVPLALGATIVALPRFSPEEVARTIKNVRATVFMGVPSMYFLLSQIPGEQRPDFSSLRFCISGGAPLPIEVMEKFEKQYGVLIYEGDGPTECSPVTAVNPVGGRRKPGSIGLPISGVEMKIVDETGKELPDGQIGEIIVRGENVMKGYLHREEETRQSFFGEYFRTGDLGYRDQDGYFFIVDRKKDMIIVNGLNVYPRMVEEVLYRHPAVAEAAVVGHPHPLHGEVPRAVLVLKPGMVVSRAEIIRFCRQYLGRHEVPVIVEFVSQLPKTPTGKILKKDLRKH